MQITVKMFDFSPRARLHLAFWICYTKPKGLIYFHQSCNTNAAFKQRYFYFDRSFLKSKNCLSLFLVFERKKFIMIKKLWTQRSITRIDPILLLTQRVNSPLLYFTFDIWLTYCIFKNRFADYLHCRLAYWTR